MKCTKNYVDKTALSRRRELRDAKEKMLIERSARILLRNCRVPEALKTTATQENDREGVLTIHRSLLRRRHLRKLQIRNERQSSVEAARMSQSPRPTAVPSVQNEQSPSSLCITLPATAQHVMQQTGLPSMSPVRPLRR